MPRSVIVQETCDPCSAGGVDTPAESVTLSIDRGAPRELLLCKAHRHELVEPLEGLLESHGVRVDSQGKPKGNGGGRTDPNSLAGLLTGNRRGKPATGERAFQCLWCPLDFVSPGSLVSHAHKLHGLPRNLTGLFGRQCPLCGESGFEVISAHLQRQHKDGPSNVSQAFVWAREHGDPHGVYAGLMETHGVKPVAA